MILVLRKLDLVIEPVNHAPYANRFRIRTENEDFVRYENATKYDRYARYSRFIKVTPNPIPDHNGRFRDINHNLPHRHVR